MSKKSDRRRRPESGPIDWDRVRSIFDNPRPPVKITQCQFDYGDEALERLARTPHTQIDFRDLWYYYHDLAAVELQPDLFDYLFPACLMHWHVTLMQNEACGRGDIEFHDALVRGNVLEKMVTPARKDAIYVFFRDSFLERLDAERGFALASPRDLENGWLARFNTLGCLMPRIDMLWEPWWSLATPGRAVAALKYCSGLMYPGWANPLYGQFSRLMGSMCPYLNHGDSGITRRGWMRANLDFLTRTLTVEFVEEHVEKAVARLEKEPEREKARQLLSDFPERREMVALRVAELPLLLAKHTGPGGWSV